MIFKVFWVHTGRYGLRFCENGSYNFIYYLAIGINFGLNNSKEKNKIRIQLSKTIQMCYSTNAEILIFSIPEASGLRRSIRLVKLVSQVLAQACNLSYGAEMYQTCITNQKIYQNPCLGSLASVIFAHVCRLSMAHLHMVCTPRGSVYKDVKLLWPPGMGVPAPACILSMFAADGTRTDTGCNREYMEYRNIGNICNIGNIYIYIEYRELEYREYIYIYIYGI